MITKINKIKNLGIFQDFTWNTQLPNFRRYNLLYGWTGVGKTTLSKLFNILEEGGVDDFPDLEYEIEDENGNKFKNSEPFDKKIKVFNDDYIKNNLKIQEGKAKAITLVLGGVNKEIKEQIEADEKELNDKNAKLKVSNQDLDKKNKDRGKTFTEIAKTIYAPVAGGAIRNYRKDNAESDFKTLTKKELLSDEQLNKNTTIVKQNSKPEIEKMATILIKEENEDTGDEEEFAILDYIKDITSESEKLLKKTVDSEIIKRIKENQDISDWVETGIGLHQTHKSQKCEFCNQDLPEKRITEITKHFNEEDKKLKGDIDTLITKLKIVYTTLNNILCKDKSQFYDELQVEYEDTITKFNNQKQLLLESVTKFAELVKDKKTKTTEVMTLNITLEIKEFIDEFNNANSFIEKHNKKTQDFENEKSTAFNKLKKHYLSTIFDDVKILDEEITKLQNDIIQLKNGDPENDDDLGIDALKKRISENQKQISSTHKACGDINDGLSTFLGRKELIFEPHKTKVLNEDGVEEDVEDGYIIKRHGEPAKNLSEGEKTAIAFVYFTIHLKEQNFDLKNGIVVVDDPISSLDSNSIFQAFAFLKTALKDAKQIFVSTHNFEFLKLMLNWMKNLDHGNNSQYFMVKNYYKDDKRCAFVDIMDKELHKYESEYHFLFKKIKEFESDGTIAQSYPIPNLARKILDTFLLFRIPSGGNIYSKLEKLKETTDFDEGKITAIYKFVNNQSHITGSGFDPSLVPETQKNVKYLLELIETVFPEHYKILVESIS